MAAALPAVLRGRRRALDLDGLRRAARRPAPSHVLLHLSLTGLAEVEAVAGLRGVEVLRREVAARVLRSTQGTVAVSGDAVLVLGPPEQVQQVLDAVAAPVSLLAHDGAPLPVLPQVAAGVAACASAPDVDTLLHDASAAARRSACGRPAPAAADDRLAADERLRVERLLRRAVPEGLLRLHYQPLVDLTNGAVLGAEALVRLQDDDGTLVPPDAFVPLAEATGLVVELGTWVLREACRQLAAWRPRCPTLASVAVNVSACQVCRPDFADVVLAALADWGLPGSALVLELTESVLLEAGPAAHAQLSRLAAHGVRTGVDDFGTGYASLACLRSLPVQFVKVDRSFVSGLPASAADAALVSAVLRLADDLGLDCVAEGIETPAQLAALQGLGAARGQGYLLSRPLPPERFAATLLGSLLPAAAPRVPRARAAARV